MMKESKCIGFVGFDWVKEHHKYSEAEEKLLSIFSGMLINLRIRKEIDEELNRFKNIADHSHYGKVISDLNGNITYVNKFFANIHGYEQNEILGKHLSIFHTEKQMYDVNNELRKLKSEGFFDSSLIWHSHKDENVFPMLMTALLMHDENQKPEYMAATALDVTELIQTQERVKALLKIEAHLNENVQNFTYIVSHNLRIHTANMIGLLMVAKETEPELFQNEIIQMLLTASENLEETIKDLNTVLEIKLNSQIKKKQINLHELVNQSAINHLDEGKNNVVEIQNLIPLDQTIFSEITYLKSILSHIIGNGIRYHSDQRSSWVKISSIIQENLTKIIIEDNGTGIDLKRNGGDLFKMYKKFHSSPQSKGLGLYITLIQVEALAGSIEVESELGKGSKFTVNIPHA